ncbi:MAG: acyl carrier protein [Alphaproteobacteria bacterium]|nr:acyl carrier protein [Alphaproteobacteria bacterium]
MNTTKKDVFAQILPLAAVAFHTTEDEIHPDSRFEDLYPCSLDMVELVCELEKKFKVEIPDELAFVEWKQMSDVADYIAAKIK